MGLTLLFSWGWEERGGRGWGTGPGPSPIGLYETIVRQNDDIFCKLFAIILGAVARGDCASPGMALQSECKAYISSKEPVAKAAVFSGLHVRGLKAPAPSVGHIRAEGAGASVGMNRLRKKGFIGTKGAKNIPQGLKPSFVLFAFCRG